LIIGAGKASARMAEAAEAHYGRCEGLVITRYGYARPCIGIEIIEAAHPVPDAAGVAATQKLLGTLSDLEPDDMVLALISGGGSALLCAPIEGVSFAEKQALNDALLASGAPISDMNVVRKQVSKVKGGRLAAACYPAELVTLMISDVPGDDPSLIASGPTVGDDSSAQEALDILERWRIETPQHLRDAIAANANRVTTRDPRLTRARHAIVAAPSKSLRACVDAAQAYGIETRVLGDAIEGEARGLARAQAEMARKIAAELTPSSLPVLLLSGGECTVTRRGDGVGGPNAEFTLAAMLTLDGHPQVHVLACDTDGVDGAADVAGAYAGPQSLELAHKLGVDAAAALARNDAHSFFEKIDSQIVCGPTLTNVNDFRALLIMPPA